MSVSRKKLVGPEVKPTYLGIVLDSGDMPSCIPIIVTETQSDMSMYTDASIWVAGGVMGSSVGAANGLESTSKQLKE